jgi:LmbE family N-acetylglucosaminyl deacetylase
MGWVDNPRAYLPTFDVYCLPSRFEGFPLAMVEAMLAERPIVASAVSSVAEAIRDGETGLLVPPDDEHALANALRRLLDDRNLASALGRRAYDVAVEEFTSERMATAYEALYEEILAGTESQAVSSPILEASRNPARRQGEQRVARGTHRATELGHTLGAYVMGARGDVRLTGRIAVVSTHPDDAVFSVGATMSAAARSGAEISVITMLAGDPGSRAPAGPWDVRAGFRTAGEAARERRLEDGRACEIIGARSVCLPFGDDQYERGGTDDEIFAALVAAIGEAETVLIPGRPLTHVDHAWLRDLIAQRSFPPHTRVLRYLEQPYAVTAPGTVETDDLQRLYGRLSDRLTKIRAIRAYPSQLRLLGQRSIWAMSLFEAQRGGESLVRRAP